MAAKITQRTRKRLALASEMQRSFLRLQVCLQLLILITSEVGMLDDLSKSSRRKLDQPRSDIFYYSIFTI